MLVRPHPQDSFRIQPQSRRRHHLPSALVTGRTMLQKLQNLQVWLREGLSRFTYRVWLDEVCLRIYAVCSLRLISMKLWASRIN